MSDKVRIMSLGGLSAIGAKNCYLIIYRGLGLILDCGIEIPDDDEDDSDGALRANHIPSFAHIPDDVERIIGVAISHDHLDHVGALNDFVKFHETSMRFRSNPLPLVFAPPYSANMIQSREYKAIKRKELELQYTVAAQPSMGHYESFIEPAESDERFFYDRTTNAWSKRPTDDCVALKFFKVNHSVTDAMGILVEVGGKRIIYSGDVRFHGMNQAETTEFARVLEDPELKNADVLMLDSTGVDKPGTGQTEDVPMDNILSIIENNSHGRVFVATFGSHPKVRELIRRLGIKKVDREVFLIGGSMQDHMKWGHRQRPLWKKDEFVPGNWKLYRYNRDQVPENAIIFLTGSQGEPLAALTRLLDNKMNRDMANIHLRPQDAVVFAARTIPGRGVGVAKTLHRLSKKGCKIYFPTKHGGGKSSWAKKAGGLGIVFEDLHVSGHAPQEDLKQIAEKLSPKAIMPIHADMEQRRRMTELFYGQDIDFLIVEEHQELVVP